MQPRIGPGGSLYLFFMSLRSLSRPRKRIWIPSLLPQRLRVQLAKKLALSAGKAVGITIVSLVLESGEK